MEFFSLVFRLGVVLAIFSFIWGLLQFALTILRGGQPLAYPIKLTLKLVQYILIADITIMFCERSSKSLELDLALSGLILLIYFIGKVQQIRMRRFFVQIQGQRLKPQEQFKPNMNLEFGVIGLSLGLFAFLAFYPDYAVNPVSTWFYQNIIGIEKAPFFGFIFKVVGFFFTLSILFRMVNAFSVLLSGQAFKNPNDKNDNQSGGSDRDSYRFDEYEEVE